MPKDLRHEIENHLATYPERVKDMDELRTQWDDYKAKAFWVLVGFTTSILSIGIWVGTIQANIESINRDHLKIDQEYAQVEQRVGSLEINNGEIRTRLASIEVTLQEIKTAIIKLQ